MTSAVKASSSTVVAVRHTPLMATESPGETSGVSVVRTCRRTPSAVSSTVATSPRSMTSPVNISGPPLPLPDAGRDQDVVADALRVQRQRPHRLGDALGSLALERVARAGAPEDDGRDEERDGVDLAGVQERAREVRAALDHDRGDPGGAELVQRGAH